MPVHHKLSTGDVLSEEAVMEYVSTMDIVGGSGRGIVGLAYQRGNTAV